MDSDTRERGRGESIYALCQDEERVSARLLLEILHVLGFRQAEIARYPGVHRSQPNRWAQGKRPLPHAYKQALERLIDGYSLSSLSLEALQRLNALYEQLNEQSARMTEKIESYIDHGVVLRELWSLTHGTQSCLLPTQAQDVQGGRAGAA